MLTHIEHSTWAGAVQFGPFNRLRMCPVLEVCSLLVFVACVLFGPVGKSMIRSVGNSTRACCVADLSEPEILDISVRTDFSTQFVDKFALIIVSVSTSHIQLIVST